MCKLYNILLEMRVEDLPCYCISLARRPDRWVRFSTQPGVAKLPKLERLDGVDGKLIDVKNDDRINPFTKRNILNHTRRSHEEIDSTGAIGCALSHRAAWQKFLESGAEYALIMEDDAAVPNGFVEQLNNMLETDKELRKKTFDMLVFTRVKRFRKGHPTNSGFAPVDGFVLAHAYILNRRSAQIFFDKCIPISHHIDFYMSIQAYMHGLTVLGSKMLIMPQAGQRSDIQTMTQCKMCDTPTDWFKNNKMIPNWEYYAAKGSEYTLLALVAAYIFYRWRGATR
jgi:GR25 family glycosyltransferase involved in LPS biosynthesis